MPCNESDRSEWHKYDAVINSQADIDNGALRGLDGEGDILIQGAKGSLDFTHVPSGYGINVICNPDLQKISFTEYFEYPRLNISEAPALTEFWMTPSNKSESFCPSANISIRAASKLGGGLRDRVWDLHEFNCSTLDELVIHDAGGFRFEYLTTAKLLDIADTTIFADKLEVLSNFRMENSNSRSAPLADFKALKSVTGNLYAGNGSMTPGFFSIPAVAGLGIYQDLAIQKSLVIGPWHSSSQKQSAVHPEWKSQGLSANRLTTVGGDLNITQNADLPEISFNGLTDVKRLFIMGNPNSTVPGDFSRLAAADYIYVNGRMNTTFPLFPHLSTAAEARIEPWNADFDCSPLVKMRDAGRIGVLYCNGTNGSENRGGVDNPGSGLSTAASVGIGVGIGALAIIAALIWLAAYYRRRMRILKAESHNGRSDDHKETIQGETEPAGAQLDDTHIREAGGRSLPHQVGGGEILEAGGRALPAEAGDQRTMVDVASALPQETKASLVELA